MVESLIYLTVFKSISQSLSLNPPVFDRAERNDFWPWLFYSPFLFPPKKEGRRKGEWIAKIVIKSHAFLLDPSIFVWLGCNPLVFALSKLLLKLGHLLKKYIKLDLWSLTEGFFLIVISILLIFKWIRDLYYEKIFFL